MAGQRAASAFLRLFLPEQCPGCHSRVAEPGPCSPCAEEIQRLLALPVPFVAGELSGFAAGPYRGVWKSVVLAYKKDPVPGVANLAHRVMLELVRNALGPGELQERVVCEGEGGVPVPLAAQPVPRVVVPVPMARVRRREKGWNPPEHLAVRLAADLGWPVAPDILERVHYRGTLASSDKDERARRLSGAIRLRKDSPETLSARAAAAARVAGTARTAEATRTGKRGWLGSGAEVDRAVGPEENERSSLAEDAWPVRALLVDDVVTTGATLGACRDALFEAGFYDVVCVTLARTE